MADDFFGSDFFGDDDDTDEKEPLEQEANEENPFTFDAEEQAEPNDLSEDESANEDERADFLSEPTPPHTERSAFFGDDDEDEEESDSLAQEDEHEPLSSFEDEPADRTFEEDLNEADEPSLKADQEESEPLPASEEESFIEASTEPDEPAFETFEEEPTLEATPAEETAEESEEEPYDIASPLPFAPYTRGDWGDISDADGTVDESELQTVEFEDEDEPAPEENITQEEPPQEEAPTVQESSVSYETSENPYPSSESRGDIYHVEEHTVTERTVVTRTVTTTRAGAPNETLTETYTLPPSEERSPAEGENVKEDAAPASEESSKAEKETAPQEGEPLPEEEEKDDKDDGKGDHSVSSDLIRGHINTIILRSLYDGDKYGYEIIAEIERKSHNQYSLKQPSLYSALKRLEKDGYITSYWGGSVSGGRRKYFSLTDEGKAISERNQNEWEYSRTVIDSLISDKDFDFSSPAPSTVDMRVLRKSTSRVPRSDADEGDYEGSFENGYDYTETETAESVETTHENEYSAERAALEEERTRMEEDLKRREEMLRVREEAGTRREQELLEREFALQAKEERCEEEEKELENQEILKHEEEIRAREEEIDRLRREAEEREEEIERLRLEAEERDESEESLEEIERLRKEAEEREEEIERLRLEAEEQEKERERIRQEAEEETRALLSEEHEQKLKEAEEAARQEEREKVLKEIEEQKLKEQEEEEARRREEEEKARLILEAQETARQEEREKVYEELERQREEDEKQRRQAETESELERLRKEAEERDRKIAEQSDEIERAKAMALNADKTSQNERIMHMEPFTQERALYEDRLQKQAEEFEKIYRRDIADAQMRVRAEDEEKFRKREHQIIHQNYINLIRGVHGETNNENAGSYYYTPPESIEPYIYGNKPEKEREYRSTIQRLFGSTLRENEESPKNTYEAEKTPPPPPPEPQIQPPRESEPSTKPQSTTRTQKGLDFYDLEMRAEQDGIKVSISNKREEKTEARADTRLVNKGKVLFISAAIVFLFCLVEGAISLGLKNALHVSIAFPIIIWGTAAVLLLTTGLMFVNHYGERALRQTGNVIVNTLVAFALTIIVTLIVALARQIDFTDASQVMQNVVIPILFFSNIVVFGLSYYFLIRPRKDE